MGVLWGEERGGHACLAVFGCGVWGRVPSSLLLSSLELSDSKVYEL